MLIRRNSGVFVRSSAAVATRYRQRGVVIVFTAVILWVLLLLFGLAADTAYVYWTAAQLQNAADAAALAGAQEVSFNSSQAVTDAVNTAADNRAGGAAVQLNSATDVVLGNFNTSTNAFTASATPYNAVQVTARRNQGSAAGPLNLLFGPIFGIKTSNVVRSAVAMTETSSNVGLLVLAPSGSSTTLVGNASISVTNGDVVIDSNSSNALVAAGNAAISATQLDITGNDTGASGDDPSGTVKLNQPVMPDPLAALAPPTKPAAASGGAPGYYGSGISLSGNSSMTLTGGIYYIDGGITLTGNASLNASAGCLIYLHTGGISMAGNGDFQYAPMSSGTYAGISIYEDRGDSSADSFAGNANISNTGTVYLPAAALSFAGNAKSVGTELICNTVNVVGNGTLNVNTGSGATASHTAYLVQ